MSAIVLVAYATSYGSTKEVAEEVAATLRECGLQVELQAMRNVRTVAGHNAVVMGAPLYMFRWHKDARRFLFQQREGLTKRPVAIFALGPFTTGDQKEWKGSPDQLDKELAEFPWLAPVAIEVFGGKFDPAKLRFPYTLIGSLKRLPASDLRDWRAIRAWASKLAAELNSDYRIQLQA